MLFIVCVLTIVYYCNFGPRDTDSLSCHTCCIFPEVRGTHLAQVPTQHLYKKNRHQHTDTYELPKYKTPFFSETKLNNVRFSPVAVP